MGAQTARETERSTALHDLGLLDIPSQLHLDAVCRTAASLLDAPIVLVTLIDHETVWIKAGCGIETKRVPLDVSLCKQTIQMEAHETLVLHDLLRDAKYSANPLVRDEPRVRFYAGAPIALNSGVNIGTLCVLDTKPRPDFEAKQIQELQDLTRIVEAHLRLHEARLSHEIEIGERRRVESLLVEREQHYRLLAENTTDVIIWSELDTTRRYVSPAAKSVLGYDPEELLGTRPLAFVHPDDVAAYGKVLDDLSLGRVERTVTRQRYRRKDGTWVWIEVSFSLTHDADGGRATGYVAALRDISSRKAVEDALRLSEERLALALDSSSDGLWDLDITSGETCLSGHWLSILGYDEGEITPHIREWEELTHPEDAERTRGLLFQHFKGLIPSFECEYRIKTKAGGYIWTLARGKVVARDTTGRALRMVGTHTDITRRKEAERLIAHMALHDALTGLPNRTLFRDRLDHEIRGAERHGSSFAILACDLDRFKAVNDTWGHAAGDAVLRTIAERLKAVGRDGDTVARLGGDEFAIILGELDQPQRASLVAQRAIESIESPIEIDGRMMSVGMSVGIAVGPADGRDADHLFKNADIALYRAKAAGRNTYRFFEAGMDALIAERNMLEHDLRDAVRRGGLMLRYQPVINLASGAVCGCEALLRWQHPTRGAISPAEFIPLAEETGLIVALGEWVLREACREAATWPADMRMAVNVSAVQFQRPGLEHAVLMALAASGLAANRLELEITESVLMQDAAAVIACLHRLRALGVRIALDDFGTGYSSLNYLRQFPFNKIKIDRTFIREIDDPDTAAIVRAVVGLGVRVGAAVTAEGVETERQLERVREEGCTEVQGFLFAKPMASEQVLRFLQGKLTRAAA